MVNMFSPLVSCFPAASVVGGSGEQAELILEASTGVAHDLGHSGLPAKELFTVLACRSSDGNLGRDGGGAHGVG